METGAPDKSPRTDGRLAFSQRMGAIVAAVVTLAVGGFGTWGFIYLNWREPDPQQNIVGQMLTTATDRTAAILCLGVAVAVGVSAPVFIFWSLLPHRPDDKAGRAEGSSR